jgi:hypothetical protein
MHRHRASRSTQNKRMHEKHLQGPIRHQYEAHHAQNVELEDLIWREYSIICSVKAGQDIVKIRTESYGDFILAKGRNQRSSQRTNCQSDAMSKNKNAVALGKMAAGHKKTMTPAALKQRRDAAKSKSMKANLRKSCQC